VASERVERKLAAILAADVVGYSRLTGADEEGTIGRIQALRREIIDPAIAAHRGRIIKTTGDGIPYRVRERGGCSTLCRRVATGNDLPK
jgi:adenylate cyclase